MVEGMKGSRGKKGIAVLGLDGLPYWSLKGLAEEGVAPFLFNDKTVGSARRLEALPPITPASWPSIMSGVNPGKHGIFSFIHLRGSLLDYHLTSFWDLMHPRVHEILSFNNMRSLMVNPVPGYPILPVKHSMIVSNVFFTPRPLSSPRGLHEKYFGDVPMPLKKKSTHILAYINGVKRLLEDVLRNPPPLTWITLNFPDIFFHAELDFVSKPWKHHHRIWREVDGIAKMLYEAYGDVVVVSDHGFRVFDARVNVNDILKAHGLVEEIREGERVPDYVKALTIGVIDPEQARGLKHKRLPKTLSVFLEKTRLLGVARAAYLKILKPLYRRITGQDLVIERGGLPSFERSRALLPYKAYYGVYAMDEEALEKALEALRGSEGLAIVERSDKLYSGPYVGRGPHITVIPDFEKGYDLGSWRLYDKPISREIIMNHDFWGVLLRKSEDGLGDGWDTMPRSVPNHVVAGLVLCRLGVPLSVHQDSREIVERACGGRVEYRDYTSRFLLAKKMLRRRLEGQKRG